MKFTQPQLNATRRRAEEFEAKAMSNARSASRLRVETRGMIARAAEIEWNATFWEGTKPERAAGMRENLPRFQAAIERNVEDILTFEESMATNVAAALAEKRVLDRYERRSEARRERGLWLLTKLCWKGWRAARLAS